VHKNLPDKECKNRGEVRGFYIRGSILYLYMYYILASIFLLLFLAKSLTFSRLNRDKDIPGVLLDSSFFISYIFVQQVALFLFWLLLRNHVDSLYQVVIVGITFSVLHVRFFFKYRMFDGYVFTIFSLLGGMIFAYLYIDYYLLGLFIAFLIHIGFHILLDILFSVRGGKPMKYYKTRSVNTTRRSE
jgi:hypothetical protein